MGIRQYAEFAACMNRVELPDEVRHHARRCLVDWFAAAIAGCERKPSFALQGLVPILAKGAELLPHGAKTSVRDAALVNGTAAHTVEFDDIYRNAIYHPGAPTIAAALAAAQARGHTGATLLAGIVSGYEISNRIGAAIAPSHYQHWHPTGTVGTFGAAAAVSAVIGLDRDQCAHALTNGATMAAGLQAAFRSDAMSKPMHAGRAAEAGSLAALAAERGVTGAAGALAGFAAAMSESSAPEWQTEDLGDRYTITETTQKNHGCCGHTFAALDALLALRDSHAMAWEHIKEIRVGTYATALTVTDNHKPASPDEAKFSLPYCAAVALLDGSVRLAAFTPARWSDPIVHALMAKVSLYVDEEAQAAFPARRGACVALTMDNGETLHKRMTTRKGDPDCPLSDHELNAKYLELASPVLGEPAAQRLLEKLWRFDQLDSVRGLCGPTHAPVAPVA